MAGEAPGDLQRDDRLALYCGGHLCRCSGPLWLYEITPGRPAAGRVPPVSVGDRPSGAGSPEPRHLRARLSLIVGLAATTLNVLVAALIGVTSGFLGGKIDLAAQRFVDAWMAFPGLLLLLTIMSIVGQGLLQIVVVLGITGGIGGSRVVRGAVIGIKENDYFLAAKAVGVHTTQILIRHVLPNIMAPVIIIFSINIGAVILSEASLSFLGFGLPPDVPSWGGLLSREGRKYMEQAPWLALWPGLFLTIVVYSFNMFGDALRDLLDPRLRGGQGSYGAAKRKRKRGLLARLLSPFNW